MNNINEYEKNLPLDDFEIKHSRNSVLLGNICFVISTIFAIWFLVTSWMWLSFANLIISYPIGLISLILYYFGNKYDHRYNRYRSVKSILISGLIISVVVLIPSIFYL